MLIAAIVALWGALGTAVGIIRHLYAGRVTDRDATIIELKATIGRLETMIAEKDAKYDRREQEYITELRTTIQTLSTSQSNVTKQNDFIESVMISLLGRDMGEADTPKALPNRRSS